MQGNVLNPNEVEREAKEVGTEKAKEITKEGSKEISKEKAKGENRGSKVIRELVTIVEKWVTRQMNVGRSMEWEIGNGGKIKRFLREKNQ